MKRLVQFISCVGLLALVPYWAVSRGPQETPSGNGFDAAKAPRMVILIRHAEKPPREEHSPHLTPTGVQRAQRIPMLFSPANTAALPRPGFLFATHASASSNREVETLQPLAQTLHLELNDQYSEDEIEKLAAELFSGKYTGKVVVVCWHHGKLPALAAALGVPNPPLWPDSVFDRIWKVEWVHAMGVLTDLPQNLLPGDSQ